MGLEKLLGTDPTLNAEQLGVGPIADTVLANYMGNTALGVDLTGAVFGTRGQPLWLGRTARYATDAQLLALIIRDKACVKCNAPHDQCQAHHLTPWNAPAKGETDINKLALLCTNCHTELHTNNHTLYQDRTTGLWHTRPATPAETPPPPPTQEHQPKRRTQPSTTPRPTPPTPPNSTNKPPRTRAA